MSPIHVRSSRARRRIVIAGGLFGLALAGTGVAAALGGLSTDEVEPGMPGGSWILIGTDPTCTTTDDVVYDCTLANPPQPEWTFGTDQRVNLLMGPWRSPRRRAPTSSAVRTRAARSSSSTTRPVSPVDALARMTTAGTGPVMWASVPSTRGFLWLSYLASRRDPESDEPLTTPTAQVPGRTYAGEQEA